MTELFRRLALVLAIVCGALAAGHAQWLGYPAPGAPRLPDGKVNLSAKAPRTRDGKPDLSGVWQTQLEPTDGKQDAFLVPGDDPRTFSKYFFNILADFKPEEAPIRPEAAKRWQAAAAHPAGITVCLPPGVPLADTLPAPHKIVQTPGLTMILYEADTSFRQIYTDGRKLPADPQPAWMGYSVGHWEGDVLVVEAGGFNDRSQLDAMAHPHSEAMHVTERFHRLDFGHMELQVTIDDPQAYTKPFTFQVVQRLLPDTDLIESICAENEKDSRHMAAK
jgi:hypothetical protein